MDAAQHAVLAESLIPGEISRGSPLRGRPRGKGLPPPPPKLTSQPRPSAASIPPIRCHPHYTFLPVFPNKSRMRSAFHHTVLAPFLRVVNGLSKTVMGFNYQTHNQFWANISNKIISYETPRPVINLSALHGFENSKWEIFNQC